MFLSLVMAIFCLTAVSATEAKEPWYRGKNPPVTFSAALSADREFLGVNHRGWRMRASNAMLCGAMESVGLPCDFNTRFSLSLFLTVNGKGLFPASGRTNPYFSEYRSSDPLPNDGYIGLPRQNEILAAAIRRNAHLFKNGDLSAKAVRSDWR
ncbi:MAG: hypothetical protein WCO21_00965 [bacterium]